MKINDIAYVMTVGKDNLWHPERCKILGIKQEKPYLPVDYFIKTRKYRFTIESKYLFPDIRSCQESCDNYNEFLKGIL